MSDENSQMDFRDAPPAELNIFKKENNAHQQKKNVRFIYDEKKKELVALDSKDVKTSYSLSLFKYVKLATDGTGITLNVASETSHDSSVKLIFLEHDKSYRNMLAKHINEYMKRYASKSSADKKAPPTDVGRTPSASHTDKPCGLISKKVGEGSSSRPSSSLSNASVSGKYPMNDINSLSDNIAKSNIDPYRKTTATTPKRAEAPSRQQQSSPFINLSGKSQQRPNNNNNGPRYSPMAKKQQSPVRSKWDAIKDDEMMADELGYSQKKTTGFTTISYLPKRYQAPPKKPKEADINVEYYFPRNPKQEKLKKLSYEDNLNRRLDNIGNTCYMNAIFQALSAVRPFMAKVRSMKTYMFELYPSMIPLISFHRDSSISKIKPQFLQAFFVILERLFERYNVEFEMDRENNFKTPSSELHHIYEMFSKLTEGFTDFLQQDAHEFLICVLTITSDIAEAIARYELTALHSPDWMEQGKRIEETDIWNMCPSNDFRIETEMKILCNNCQYVRLTQDFQSDLGIPMRDCQNLTELISDVFPCTLGESTCEKCKESGHKMSHRIKVFPPSIILNLKRYERRYQSTKKRQGRVDVALTIDLSELQEHQTNVRNLSSDNDNSPSPKSLRRTQRLSEVTNSDKETPKKSADSSTITPKKRPSSHMSLFGSDKKNDENSPYMITHYGGASPVAMDCDSNYADEREKERMDMMNGNLERMEMEIDDKKVSSSNFTPSPSPPPRLFGGADPHLERENSADSECLVVGEKLVTDIEYRPLNDADQVMELLEMCGIEKSKASVEQHLKKWTSSCFETIPINRKPNRLQPVDGDGNCYYRAVSWYLTGSELYHEPLRAATVKFIADNLEIFQKTTNESMEEYVKLQAQECIWATDHAILAMATMFNINIFVFLNNKWSTTKPLPQNDGSTIPTRIGSIYLKNEMQLHYDAVRSVDVRPGPTTRKRSPVEGNEEDDEMPRRKSPKEEDENGNCSTTPSTRTSARRNARNGVSYEGMDVDSTPKKKKRDPIKYALQSVVCHQGPSPSSGHYVSYTKDYIDNKWYYCSDHNVYEVEELEMLTDAADTGYIFYYTKI